MCWDQLLEIEHVAQSEAEQYARQPLVDCPVCATRLQEGPTGLLDCPWGDWREAGGDP